MSGESDDFQFLGDFQPPEARKILARLEERGWRFEIACDDGISQVNPLFGSSGTHACIRIFIGSESFEESRSLVDEIMG